MEDAAGPREAHRGEAEAEAAEGTTRMLAEVAEAAAAVEQEAGEAEHQVVDNSRRERRR